MKRSRRLAAGSFIKILHNVFIKPLLFAYNYDILNTQIRDCNGFDGDDES